MAKILVVEDDAAVADMLTSLLRGEMHAVEVVSSGLDAATLLKLNPYDLVVLDWNLPDALGPAILKANTVSTVVTPLFSCLQA